MLARIRSLWRALFHGGEVARDMADEMRFHIEARSEDLMRSGFSPAEAYRRAHVEFGGVEGYKEQCREARGLRVFDELRADSRYAIRTLLRNPSFSVTAILTLALAIGANTGFFTMVNTLLLRPIAVQAPWSLYQVSGYAANRTLLGAFSQREYLDLSSENGAFTDVIADAQVRARWNGVMLGGYAVSGNYFTTLGVGTLLGRPIFAEDAVPGAPAVAVLSHAAWQRVFHGDASIVGKAIDLSGDRPTIIGVAASEFTGLDPLIPDFWVPLPAKARLGGRRDASAADSDERVLRVIGRLRPGITPVRAQASLAILLPRLSESRPKELRLLDARLDSRATYQSWNHADPANVIPVVTAGFLILLIACTNLSNLLLARALNRQREIAVRLSLGASRGRIVRQLVTESAVLALAAGCVGLALSHWSWILIRREIVSAVSAKSVMSIIEVTPDYRVFGFTFALALSTGILFGLFPALAVTRTAAAPAVKLGGALLGSTILRSRLRDGLVVVQFSLALVLLVGAGILIRSATEFGTVEPGFDLVHTISVQTVDESRADDTLQSRLAERLRNVPGIQSVSHVLREPLRGNLPTAPIAIGGEEATARVGFNEVSSDYFGTLGIPMRLGRGFTAQEAASDAPVAVVSEATARRFWPARNPLGQTIRLATPRDSPGGRDESPDPPRTFQVVGVAQDVVSAWLWNGPIPAACICRHRPRDCDTTHSCCA